MRNTGVLLLYCIPIAFYNLKLLQDSISVCVYTHLHLAQLCTVKIFIYFIYWGFFFLRNHTVYV